MQKVNFDEAVTEIREGDSRYAREAYGFVRDALDFTLKRRRDSGRAGEEEDRHVGGVELLDGFREYALGEFGPMVTTVLDEWGIGICEDVGHIVFNLIGSGIFGKADNDSIEDFRGGFEFEEAFVDPFLPAQSKGSAGAVNKAEEPRVRSRDS